MMSKGESVNLQNNAGLRVIIIWVYGVFQGFCPLLGFSVWKYEQSHIWIGEMRRMNRLQAPLQIVFLRNSQL
jgi:hypothetical protein